MRAEYLFLDTETFSPVDIKSCGAYAYAEHPETEIMICAYAIDRKPVQKWDATDGSDMPDDLRAALKKVKRGRMSLVGQNFLMFDRLVIKNCWRMDIPVEHIIDTMVVAFRHALPGSLAGMCDVFQLSADMAKDKRGKALIQRFCKPTPKNYKIRRYTRETHPKEWAEFIEYAESDITSMREIFYNHLPDWGNTDFENAVLVLDQKINDTGFFVDTKLARSAIAAVGRHKKELREEAAQKWGASLTGAGFLPALRDAAPAHDVPNAQKSTLNDLLADEDLPDEARTLIEMRLGAASTASTKYKPLLLGLSADGRRRGCLQYGGAKRTLRWAGKGFQPQNLARGFFVDDPKNKEGATRAEWMDDAAWWRVLHPLSLGIKLILAGKAHHTYDIAKLTASTVRGCIIPAAGNKLVVADYSNVEGRGLAWLAGETSALETFIAGLDIYCQTAGMMFGLDPDHIKQYRKDLRQIGKACELGLGYGGGVAAFLQFAKNLGLDLYAMAETMKGTFPDHIWAAAKRGFEFARIQEKNKRGFNGQKPDRPSYDLPRRVWMTCDAIKRMWRESHPKTCQLWQDLEDAAMAAIKNPGKSYWAGAPVRENGDRAIRIVRTVTRDKHGEKIPGWWLKIELPSGRFLSYPGIGISVEKAYADDEDMPGFIDAERDGLSFQEAARRLQQQRAQMRERIRYMGENQTTRQWSKQYTYGGKLAENITQALCRDLLANALLNVDKAGWPIILHVHDEIVTEVPNEPEYTVSELEKLMCALPSWAGGFPLAAEGDELMRYAK